MLRAWLGVRREVVPEDFLFADRLGRSLTRHHAAHILYRLAKRAALTRKIGPHALRHYAATSILKQTGDLELVRQVLRHESLAMTLRYSRLRDEHVLLRAIQEGLRSREFFGYAQAIDQDGSYIGLAIESASASVHLDAHSVLVKPDVAMRQLEAEKPAKADYKQIGVEDAARAGDTLRVEEESKPITLVFRRFHGSVLLDATRVTTNAGRIAEEVIQHLTSLVRADVKVTLEIHAHIPGGVPEHVIRTVTENCKTLKFEVSGFETE